MAMMLLGRWLGSAAAFLVGEGIVGQKRFAAFEIIDG